MAEPKRYYSGANNNPQNNNQNYYNVNNYPQNGVPYNYQQPNQMNGNQGKNGKTTLIIAILAVIMIIAIACLVVFVSLNSSASWKVKVPDVVESEYEDAAEKIVKSKLYCVIADRIEDDVINKDYVLSQNPEAKKRVSEKSRVEVVLSSGREKKYFPNLENYSYDSAERILDESGFKIEKVEKPNDKYAPNTVYSQSVQEGLQEKGLKAKLYVTPSAEPESGTKVEVPNLSGKSFTDAQKELESKGLYLAVSSAEYNDSIGQNCIISQETAAGSKIAKGSIVLVKISNGRQQIFVPDVTYRTGEKAVEALEDAGLKVKEEHEESKTVAKGTVIEQSIKENEKVDKNTEIITVINDGYEVEVPDVMGMDEKDAIYALFDAELAVNIEYASDESAKTRTVIAQEFEAGEKVQFGTEVTITVNENKDKKADDSKKDKKNKNKDNKETGTECAYGNVVMSDGNIYYWKYNSRSLLNSAINANYIYSKGTKNQLICRNNAGEEKVICEREGSGELVLTKDRIFFNVDKQGSEDYNQILCSCKLDGSDVQNHTQLNLNGVTSDLKHIIGYYSNDYDGSRSLKLFNIENMQIEKTIEKASYLICSDNRLFYEDNSIDTSNEPCGRTVLKSVNFDGSDEKTVYTTQPNLYDDILDGYVAQIINPYIQGDYIYYVYGTYAGTGHVFQGGKIVKVKFDGSDSSLIDIESGEYIEGAYVVDKAGNVKFAEKDPDKQKILINEPAFIDGSVYYYNQSSDSIEKVVVPEDYKSKTGLSIYESAGGSNGDGEAYISCDFFERSGNKVFFMLSKSVHNRANDFGWRYSYDRSKSYLFEKDLNTGKVTVLNEF